MAQGTDSHPTTGRRWLPTSRRGRVLAGVAAAAVVLAGGFAAVYVLFFTPESKPRLTLGTAPSDSASSQAPASGTLAGRWVVASGSVAGYRVREQLGFLPAPDDAVGRTSAITGGFAVDGAASGSTFSVRDVSLTADLTKLQSDDGRRDRRLAGIGLQTAQFPTASFAASGPIAIPPSAVSGATETVPATGQLTIHGVTKAVTIPLQVRRDAGQIDIAGSLRFPFSQFGMTAPSVGGFVTVQSDPTLEFRVLFQHT
ncbi:MAG: YceI family protein [Actinobacteria bacterium]|nr:MAG: YceI family protein [Actinomycetota bacterium]